MRKYTLSLSILSLSALTLLSTGAQAKTNVETKHFKIDLNQQFTENSNQLSMNKKGIEYHLGQTNDHLPESFVQLDLDLQDNQYTDHVVASGHGVLKVGTDTFPFTIEDQSYPKLTLPDGHLLYTGALTGNLKAKNGDSDLILGLDYDPSRDAVFVSTFIGELNEQLGLGILRFGNPVVTKEMGLTILEMRKKAKENNTNHQGSVK